MTEKTPAVSKIRFTWGRFLLIFFVAAWMFILGVLVGRGTAPVHFDTRALQKELIAMRDAMIRKEREAVEKAIRGEDQRVPLDFYEALKEDGPDAAIQMSEVQAGTSGPVSGGADGPPRKSRPAVMAKKAKAVNKPASSDVPAASRAPDADVGGLTIQIASLKDAAAAERIVANLTKEGYAAYLSRIVIPGQGLWFRVRVGSYEDREKALRDMDRLTRDREKPILVKK